MVEWTLLIVFSIRTWLTRATKWIIWVFREGENKNIQKFVWRLPCNWWLIRLIRAMFNLSSSDNICVSQMFKLSSQQKFRLQRIISRGVTRRHVILVLTDTTGGVLSRVWKTTFTKHSLDPYYDKSDQSLLVGGRLQSSNSAIKHLIILPQGHPVVEKIIQSVTRKLLHSGPESALSVLWQEIWLIKGRREVKSVLGKCLVCQRPRVDQCSQKMEPLPLGSELSSPAFTHVGINFAGPLFVWGSPPQPRLTSVFSLAPLPAWLT